jgi:hypothetical protein
MIKRSAGKCINYISLDVYSSKSQEWKLLLASGISRAGLAPYKLINTWKLFCACLQMFVENDGFF